MTKIKTSLQSVRGALQNLLANLRQQDEKEGIPTQRNQYFT